MAPIILIPKTPIAPRAGRAHKKNKAPRRKIFRRGAFLGYLLFKATVALKLVAGVGNGFGVSFHLAFAEDAVSYRCCAEERAEGTYYHTEDHGECERTDGVATEEEDAQEHQ